MSKKIDRTGETRVMKNGLKATIIAYRNCNDMDIEFENGGVTLSKQYHEFKHGKVSCPMMIYKMDGYAKVINANISTPFEFLIDIEDLPLLGNYMWSGNHDGYARRNIPSSSILLHRLITDAPNDMEVDHANGIRTDNRRANLRVCSRSENSKNLSKHLDNASPYKGVTWDKARNKWKAAIGIKTDTVNLGRFDTSEEAAKAYNDAAIKYHGEFARLNEV